MRKDDGYQRDFWNEKTRDQEEQIPNTDSNSMSISDVHFYSSFYWCTGFNLFLSFIK